MEQVEILNQPPRASLEDLSARIRTCLDSTTVREAWVFGSYARGDADRYSDLDLLLVQSSDAPFVERGLAHAPLFELGVAIDLLVYTPEEFERMRREGAPFLTDILEHGWRIYEADR
jgi:uncharacterized protein